MFYASMAGYMSNKSLVAGKQNGPWMPQPRTRKENTMRAYLVHDAKKQSDMLVLPEMDRLIPVNREVLTDFISVRPDFSRWSGSQLNGLSPETFGRVVATREEKEDVCIVDEPLWQQRMSHLLGAP